MISINEAVKNGIERIRSPIWANREDYLQLDIIDGKLGPWVHLWSPLNEVLEQENPQDILVIGMDLDAAEWEIWQTNSVLKAIAIDKALAACGDECEHVWLHNIRPLTTKENRCTLCGEPKK